VELEELEDSDTEVAYDFDTADDDDERDISDDSDSDSDDDSDSGSDSDGVQVAVLDIKKMTKKLDGMLFLVFSYLEGYVNSCRHLPTPNGRMPAPVEELFLVLLQIFMGTILQTFKSRHTQFILFYIVSLSPQFSDYFLGALGTKILDKSQPEVIRVSAAAYMSSFVSRAKYLDIRQVLMVIDMLGNFVLELVAKVDTGSNVLPDADRYAVFYAVVQALMYIFCFRWRVLEVGAENKIRSSKDDFDSAGMIVGSMDSPDVNSSHRGTGRQWHSGLNSLQRVVTSRLNPLKVSTPSMFFLLLFLHRFERSQFMLIIGLSLSSINNNRCVHRMS
jgi:RNA polymerase I-specific transcription initiation factor RRN3